MPTHTYFNKYPSFPSDVTTAQLPRLSFPKILNYEKAESDAFQGMQDHGLLSARLSREL